MRSQEPPQSVGTLVKNHLDEMASGIHTAHTSRREMFSYKRLQPILSFTPASFNDGKVFSKWLSNQFYPRMVHLRVEKASPSKAFVKTAGTWQMDDCSRRFSVDGQRIQSLCKREARQNVEVAGQGWRGAIGCKTTLVDGGHRTLLKYTDDS